MPRVLPSDVVRAADQMFNEMATNPNAFPHVTAAEVPSLVALVKLVESVPNELIVVEPRQYAGLMASIAYLQAMSDVFQSKGVPSALPPRVRGFKENPVALIRAAMAACPDEAPSLRTAALPFIADPALRESIRLDISAANQDLANGEWKGATVLAGSAVETLLLWALQRHETQRQGALAAAGAALVAEHRLDHPPHTNREKWVLHEYIEVAAHLEIIAQETAAQARLVKDFRNLIHPGRAARLGQKCDRGTAFAAVAAVEFVVRDLTLAAP
jgi:hypothetical protein